MANVGAVGSSLGNGRKRNDHSALDCNNNCTMGPNATHSLRVHERVVMITLERAIVVVLELARQNICEDDGKLAGALAREANEQTEACNTIEDYFVNQVFGG